MASKTRAGELYVQVAPTLEGMSEAIEEAFSKAAKDSSKAVDDAASEAGSGFAEKFNAKAAGIAAGAGAVAAVGIATGKALFDIGDRFDGMVDSIRVGTGATGEDLEALQGIAKNIMSTIPVSGEAAANAVADINTRLGLTGDELEIISKQVLEAGRILGEDVDINAASGAFRAFGKTNEELEASMDEVFRISQATGVGFNELTTKAQQAAPAAQTLGLSFEETTSMLGILDKAGLDSSKTFAGMSKSIMTLAKDGEAPAVAFQRSIDEIDNMIKAGDELGALDMSAKLFGSKGAPQFIQAIQSGVLNVDQLQDSLGATTDTIIGTAAETNDFAEKWEILKNKALVALEPIAVAIFDILGNALESVTPILEGLIGHFEKFANWLSENEWAFWAIAAVIGGAFVLSITAATVALWGMVAPVLANPITWIILAAIAAIGLLIAAVWMLVENWDSIVSWLGDTWDGFVNGITKAAGWIGDIFVGIGKGIANFFIGIVNNVIDTINWLIDATNKIKIDLPGEKLDWKGFQMGNLPRVPALASGGTVLPKSGGTLALIAEAGKAETVVDTGLHNKLMESILNDDLINKTNEASTFNIYQLPGESTEELVARIESYYNINDLRQNGSYSFAE